MTCYNTDIFENVLEKIYLKYHKYKNKEFYYIYGGSAINNRVSFAENNIIEGSTILLN